MSLGDSTAPLRITVFKSKIDVPGKVGEIDTLQSEGWAQGELGPRGLLPAEGKGRAGPKEEKGAELSQVQDSLCSMSGMISGGHNPLGTPGTSPSQNDLASLIQA